ncbi:hypothetical protein V5E97_18135 [Singulisphaera sp. Ch08]|uniref:Uncharacterized protein n=1 Tax=Singulisphaera sp. Ch08 TaxID=3120278 RepID=A0AAU7CS19_9BACT
MNEVLIPDQALVSLDQDLDVMLSSIGGEIVIDPNDPEYGVAFRRYLLFSRWPSLLERGELHATAEELLYNSYYWMLKFSKLHERKHGYDAGIEQQVFKILENTHCNLDWNVVEQLTNLVETELGAGP